MFSFKDFVKRLLFEALAPGVKLYHREIGIPPTMTPPVPGMRLNYGNHAKQAARDENLTRVPAVMPSGATVIEVEMQNGRTIKWLVRFPSTERPGWDMVAAVMYDGFVKTLWLNHSQDKHGTLDRSKYSRP